IRAAAGPLLPQGAEAPPPGGSLVQVLEAWAKRLDGDLLVVLDQFEEYFLYHGARGTVPGSFAWELAQAVNHPTLRGRFLISLREDALARLDAFKGIIPRLFDNYLRVGRLQLESAREAVVRPVERYSQLHPERPAAIEPALVEAVLEEIGSGRMSLSERGAGQVHAEPAGRGAQIETPYLQLVMTRLWREEMRLKSATLRLQTFRKLGGAAHIAGTHLDEVMRALPRAHREAASLLFRYLVTPDGAKIAHTAETLAYYTRLPQPRVEQTLERLAAGDVRVLRNVEGHYQIFHDVMAPAVLSWRQRHLAGRRERNWGLGSVAAAAVMVALMYFFVLLPTARREAAAREKLVKGLLAQNARELAARRYAAQGAIVSGRAAGEDTDSAAFTISEPGDYAVQLVCAGRCTGAALRAYAPADTAPVAFGGRPLPDSAAETRDASYAATTLEMIGPVRGSYRLALALQCEAGSCPWAYRVYRRKPLPDSATVLITAIDRASAAVGQALRTLDARPLSAAWQDSALQEQAANVASLRAQGLYAETHLLGQEFCMLAVGEGRGTAQARIVETWRVEQRRVADGTVFGPVRKETSIQDIRLRWSKGGWRIAAIDFVPGRHC
ncbi:MAG: hypothetical protein KY444_09805, partial [Gemmatimonadetes bacterium]|nr:hypothetical protein [Gemmatimonadota bacterium]